MAHLTVGVRLRHLQGQGALGTIDRVLQRNEDLDDLILPTGAKATTATAALTKTAAEQRLEEVAEIVSTAAGVASAAKAAELLTEHLLELARVKLLTLLPVAAELVIQLALLRVGEHLIGLVDLLEPGLIPALVRVVLGGQPAERLLDLRLAGVAVHAENLVVVLVFHCASSASNKKAGARPAPHP